VSGSDTDSVYAALANMVRAGRAVSLATVISSEIEGVRPGLKMLLPSASEAATGLIHPEIDQAVMQDAERLLLEERSLMIGYKTSTGNVEVFIESFPPPQELVILGAVHVSITLAKLAKMLGYHVTVIDPRGAFATRERFPDADRLIVEWPEDTFGELNLNNSTSVVVLTHDAKLDLPALQIALNSQASYVGAIGSRTTTAERKEELARMGVTEEQLARLHSPIGLRIGARTPAEIAVSIMAEIVAERRKSRDL
jgi:xanthine dehydrogenase accessory factor